MQKPPLRQQERLSHRFSLAGSPRLDTIVHAKPLYHLRRILARRIFYALKLVKAPLPGDFDK